MPDPDHLWHLSSLKMPHGQFISLSLDALRFVSESSPHGWFAFKAGGPGVVSAEQLGFVQAYRDRMYNLLLLREDLVAQAISVMAARMTGQFHPDENAQQQPVPECDPAKIKQVMGKIIRIVNALSAYADLLERPRITVVYEDFKSGDYSSIDAALASYGLRKGRDDPAPARRAVTPVKNRFYADWKNTVLESFSPEDQDMLDQYHAFVQAERSKAAPAGAGLA